MDEKKEAQAQDVEIEPLSDDALESASGGAADLQDGSSNSCCSCSSCS